MQRTKAFVTIISELERSLDVKKLCTFHTLANCEAKLPFFSPRGLHGFAKKATPKQPTVGVEISEISTVTNAFNQHAQMSTAVYQGRPFTWHYQFCHCFKLLSGSYMQQVVHHKHKCRLLRELNTPKFQGDGHSISVGGFFPVQYLAFSYEILTSNSLFVKHAEAKLATGQYFLELHDDIERWDDTCTIHFVGYPGVAFSMQFL